jgi:hypothetical protein
MSVEESHMMKGKELEEGRTSMRKGGKRQAENKERDL